MKVSLDPFYPTDGVCFCCSYNGWSPSRPVGYLRSSIRPTTSLTAAMVGI